MQLTELEHVLRAAADITKEKSFVLVGSQAILLLLDTIPPSLLVSTELDLYPAMHPEKADLIDGAIGALSMFHDTHGFHADGVGPETAVMPPDCRFTRRTGFTSGKSPRSPPIPGAWKCGRTKLPAPCIRSIRSFCRKWAFRSERFSISKSWPPIAPATACTSFSWSRRLCQSLVPSVRR